MSDSNYVLIAQKIDESALGAPKSGNEYSPAFIEYLKLLYTPEEAEVVRYLKMPNKFTPASELARLSGKDEETVKRLLGNVASRRGIIAVGDNYALPHVPLLVNIHQFVEDMAPEDLKAAELYQQFFVKDGFYKYYESSEKGTPLVRAIPVKRAIESGQRILETEEAHEIIDAEPNLVMIPCPCRTRTEKMGSRECKDRNPVGTCIMMGMSALYFESVGMGKRVTAGQAKQYLDEMQDLGLVATTDNFEANKHSVICLCCECCCSQTRGRTRWDNPYAVSPSNFVPEANEDCIMCGTCEERCFFGAISMDESKNRAVAAPDKCIGCGVCAIGCEQEALKLKRIERSRPFASPGELFKTVAAENKGGG